MKKIIFAGLLIFSSFSFAAHSSFHGYAAFGPLYGLGTVRLGSEYWEGGMMAGGYGFAKIFDFQSKYYTSFGFSVGSSVSLYSAVGFYKKFWIFPVRGELCGVMSHQGDSSAFGLFGLTFGF